MVPALVGLALDYYRNPLRYPHLADLRQPLPRGFDAMLMSLGTALSAANIGQTAQLLSTEPAELERAARFFIRHVLLPPGGDYFRYLGLSRHAAEESVRLHYKLLIRMFHPDRAQNDNEDLLAYSSRINAAYRTLRNPQTRTEYERKLPSRDVPSDPGAFFRPSAPPLSSRRSRMRLRLDALSARRGVVVPLLGTALVAFGFVVIQESRQHSTLQLIRGEQGDDALAVPSYVRRRTEAAAEPVVEPRSGPAASSTPAKQRTTDFVAGRPAAVASSREGGSAHRDADTPPNSRQLGAPGVDAEAATAASVGSSSAWRRSDSDRMGVDDRGGSAAAAYPTGPSEKETRNELRTDATDAPTIALEPTNEDGPKRGRATPESSIQQAGGRAAEAVPPPARKSSSIADEGRLHFGQDDSIRREPLYPRRDLTDLTMPDAGHGVKKHTPPATGSASLDGLRPGSERGKRADSPRALADSSALPDAKPPSDNRPSVASPDTPDSRTRAPKRRQRPEPAITDKTSDASAVIAGARLVAQLQHAYRQGNANALSALFTTDGRTNEGTGRFLINRTYTRFFGRTVGNQLSVSNIRWNVTPDGRITGEGRLLVSNKFRGSESWDNSSGRIQLEVVRDAGRYRISRMFYRLD